MYALMASGTHHLLEVGGALALLVPASAAGWTTAVVGLLAGWAVGSFAEYGLHRYVLHGPRLLSASHRRHHARADQAQLDAVSYLAPFALQGAFGALAFAAMRDSALAQALAAGAMLQYSWFRAVHRLMHDRPTLAGLAGLCAFHDAHHRRIGANFGVTSRVWDTLFGTALGHDAAVPQAVVDTDLPLAVHDPRPGSDAPRNGFERRVARWLRDVRDLAFVRVGTRASLSLFAAAGVLYLAPPWLAVLLALPYWWLLYARHGGPVLLMVHALFHRQAFEGPGRWIDGWLRHGLPLLYGLQPFAYFPQHVLMHHARNNRGGDLSSTAGYQRDRWQDFLRYWWRFMGADNLRLVAYLHHHGHRAALWRFLAGSLAWLAAAGALLAVAPAATTIVFVLPYVLTRFFLMAGNWAQHAFVDPDATDARLGDATVLVNATQNQKCFNDGYHAVHHRRPGLHWAQMSTSFLHEWRHYAAQRVLVFDGIPNNQVIWWRLMRRDHGYLADHLADLGWLPAQRGERIALLQRRVAAPLTAPSGTAPGPGSPAA